MKVGDSVKIKCTFIPGTDMRVDSYYPNSIGIISSISVMKNNLLGPVFRIQSSHYFMDVTFHFEWAFAYKDLSVLENDVEEDFEDIFDVYFNIL